MERDSERSKWNIPAPGPELTLETPLTEEELEENRGTNLEGLKVWREKLSAEGKDPINMLAISAEHSKNSTDVIRNSIRKAEDTDIEGLILFAHRSPRALDHLYDQYLAEGEENPKTDEEGFIAIKKSIEKYVESLRAQLEQYKHEAHVITQGLKDFGEGKVNPELYKLVQKNFDSESNFKNELQQGDNVFKKTMMLEAEARADAWRRMLQAMDELNEKKN